VKHIRDENLIKSIGERIRSLRIDKNMSMENLARIADMEYKQLSKVELGQTDASISTLSALCNALGISLKELMDAEGLR
jgi:transcriptional regulator with XRE-family HTH domain